MQDYVKSDENRPVGSFLTATPLLDQTEFAGAKIFIHQSDEEGVVGFVINKIFPRTLNELAEFATSKPITLYDGGPVDRGHIFFLHTRSDMIHGGRHVTNDIYFGGNFKEAVRLINNGQISESDVKIFIGYCGWDTEQIKEEIDEGNWLPATGNLFGE